MTTCVFGASAEYQQESRMFVGRRGKRMATVYSVLSSVIFAVCDVVLWWVSMAAMRKVI